MLHHKAGALCYTIAINTDKLSDCQNVSDKFSQMDNFGFEWNCDDDEEEWVNDPSSDSEEQRYCQTDRQTDLSTHADNIDI